MWRNDIVMSAILWCLACLLILGPLVIWGLMSSMSCAFVASASRCGIRWSSFLDPELPMFASIPWIVGLISLFFAVRWRK